MTTLDDVRITPEEVLFNGTPLYSGEVTLPGLYRSVCGDYPKFFKMDGLCRLAFLGAELLLRDVPAEVKEHAAIVLFNRSGSLVTDRSYEDTLRADNYFPSPAIFVYTLANIATGEIAIRHKVYGETSFYIAEHNDRESQDAVLAEILTTSRPTVILTGWVEYADDSDFLADMRLLSNS